MNNLSETKQIIAFRRRKFLCEGDEVIAMSEERVAKVKSFLEEFERFGITFSKEVIEKASDEEMTNYLSANLPGLIEEYHEETGMEFKPLWPGFPQQVRDLGEEEFKEVQDKIYSGTLSYDDPMFSVSSGESQTGVVREIKVIDIMVPQEFMEIPAQICKSGVALSKNSNEELKWFLDTYGETLELPEKIPFKENLVTVMLTLGDKYVPSEVTDVLRFFLALSETDLVSIPKGSKEYGIKSLSRANRRKVLAMLEKVIEKKGLENCITDAKRHTGHWLLMIRNIHASDYSSRFPGVQRFIHLFSEDRGCFKTWNAIIQSSYRTLSLPELVHEISKRPGEFIRRFDSLLRRGLSQGLERDVIEALRRLTGARNKTLMELLSYYGRRGDKDSRRIVNLGGGKKKELVLLEPLSADIVDEISAVIKRKIYTNIHDNNQSTEGEGKVVVIEDGVRDIPVPIGMRGSDIDFPVGTSLDIPAEVDYIRFFVHWIQEPGKKEDLDMHGSFYSEDFTEKEHIGWNSVSSGAVGVYSGDVRHKEGGCAEYIDVDIKGALKKGLRYVSMDVYNYEDRGLDTLPCWLGYEYRTELHDISGKDDLDWNPKNPQFMIKSKCKGINCAAWVFDLVDRKAYLLNQTISSLVAPNGLDLGIGIVKFVLKSCGQINSYDILKTYYEAQGYKVVPSIPENLEETPEVITKEDILGNYARVLEVLGE